VAEGGGAGLRAVVAGAEHVAGLQGCAVVRHRVGRVGQVQADRQVPARGDIDPRQVAGTLRAFGDGHVADAAERQGVDRPDGCYVGGNRPPALSGQRSRYHQRRRARAEHGHRVVGRDQCPVLADVWLGSVLSSNSTGSTLRLAPPIWTPPTALT
jgi:hypothetical protein